MKMKSVIPSFITGTPEERIEKWKAYLDSGKFFPQQICDYLKFINPLKFVNNGSYVEPFTHVLA